MGEGLDLTLALAVRMRVTVLACLVAAARNAPAPSKADLLRFLPALVHEEVHDEFGQYALHYVTAENTVVSERGRLVPTKDGGFVLEIEGQYQFIGDDGVTYVTTYKAGPGGFQADGPHLPKSVPVPSVA